MRPAAVSVAILFLLPSGTPVEGAAARIPEAVSLRMTEPGPTSDDPTDDMVRLGDWIGEAQIVGLGEAWHGTHTLHRLAHRIFRQLVEHESFTVFALEIDQAHAAMLDEYVQGARDDLEDVFAGAWWAQRVFYDMALVDLLRWMRGYNQAMPGRPLHFAGFDIKQPRLAAEGLVAAVGEVDPRAVGELRSLLSQAFAPGAFGIYPNVWGFTGTSRLVLPEREADAPARIELTVRGEGVEYGHVGLSAGAGGDRSPRVRWIRVEDLGATGSVEVLELGVPARAESLEISVFHRGNGAVEFGRPEVRLGDRRLDTAGLWDEVETRPLMMPALQAMDYRAQVLEPPGGGARVLRITADPLLDSGLEAAQAVGARVDVLLDGTSTASLSRDEVAWTLQLARLVRQAVEWRTLAESNRGVFLAENLLWLHRMVFPGRRVLALAHTSHTERIPGKMGASWRRLSVPPTEPSG